MKTKPVYVFLALNIYNEWDVEARTTRKEAQRERRSWHPRPCGPIVRVAVPLPARDEGGKR